MNFQWNIFNFYQCMFNCEAKFRITLYTRCDTFLSFVRESTLDSLGFPDAVTGKGDWDWAKQIIIALNLVMADKNWVNICRCWRRHMIWMMQQNPPITWKICSESNLASLLLHLQPRRWLVEAQGLTEAKVVSIRPNKVVLPTQAEVNAMQSASWHLDEWIFLPVNSLD